MAISVFVMLTIIGKIQLALKSFDSAIELDPHYEPALLNRTIV